MIDILTSDGQLNPVRLVGLSLLLIILYPVFQVLYAISPFHPLSSYPGPLLWRISKLPWVIALHSGNLHQRVKSLHDEYGPRVRVAPEHISYIDPQAWRDIYAPPSMTNARGEPQGVIERNPSWVKKAKPSDPWSIMGANEEAHARYRRAFAGAFSDKLIRDYSYVLDDVASLFLQKLSILASNDEPLDLGSWFNFVTFDISGALSFGESFGSTEAGEAHPWVDISTSFGKGFALTASLNYLNLTSGPLRKLLPFLIPEKAQERIKYHQMLTHQKVTNYLDPSISTKLSKAPFIDSALNFNSTTKNKEDILTEAELSLNMSIIVFAGSETTASTLSATMTYLLQNRGHLDKVTQEIRSTFSSPSSITISATNSLPHLTAAVQESMRMSPPVVIGVPRIIPKSGAMICNDYVPPGTYVVINQFAANRSSSNFHDPDTFNPSRFLQHDEKDRPAKDTRPAISAQISPSRQVKKEGKEEEEKENPTQNDTNPESFQPFSIGRHSCIGKALAWGMVRVTLARFLYCFDVEFADPTDPNNKKDFGEQKTFVFWEKEPLMVRLRLVNEPDSLRGEGDERREDNKGSAPRGS